MRVLRPPAHHASIRFVVNTANYSQWVGVEECATENSNSGSRLLDVEPSSCLYSGAPGCRPQLTVCRQLYRAHSLVVLSPGGHLEVDTVQLPSACACFLRKDLALPQLI